MKKLWIFCISIALFSCKKEPADFIISNAVIHPDSSSTTFEAMAIKNGKILALGSKDEILSQFQASKVTNFNKEHVFPSFMDAHTHFYAYAENLSRVDLRNAASVNEVIDRLKKFDSIHQPTFIYGRGWDQSLWANQEFPNRFMLDSVFPNKAVVLGRIDGHAVWVNSKALELSGITSQTQVDGGVVSLSHGEPNGILVDNASDLIELPDEVPISQTVSLLKKAQDSLFKYGITAVMEAGLMKSQVILLDSLIEHHILDLRIDALLADNEENLEYFMAKPPINKPKFRVGGFKFYLDGALGSRGALLKDGYADDSGNFGLQLKPIAYFEEKAKLLYTNGWQMAIHAIGDSANELATNIMAHVLEKGNDRRWRIEHAQIVRPKTIAKMAEYGILPSVQPTHATSDGDWAGDRLGDAEKYAYPYKSLLSANGLIPLGTDFPVEEIDPIRTFRAAVFRKTKEGLPEKGYLINESLNHQQTLKGMTFDAAYASFWEDKIGSLEAGKSADFIVVNQNLLKSDFDALYKIKILETYIQGKLVYAY